ncbi:MAG: guanylate kinase [Lachnospiraceae bacterium]|nr:guanylate kinase [Lachnospiraceae bacterium]
MGKIFCLMGKSSTGKDTIFKKLTEDPSLNLHTIVSYTTRPIRDGELEGKEYFFVDEARLEQLSAAGRVIEQRAYQTFHGIWKYFTADDGQIDLKNKSYLIIGTPESYRGIREYFGRDNVVALLITLDDGERLQRALDREKMQEKPRYEEMCRRFLSDAQDFSAEKIREAGIERSFENNDLAHCLAQIREYILGEDTD